MSHLNKRDINKSSNNIKYNRSAQYGTCFATNAAANNDPRCENNYILKYIGAIESDKIPLCFAKWYYE
jgi:hypothetical protein